MANMNTNWPIHEELDRIRREQREREAEEFRRQRDIRRQNRRQPKRR